MVDNSTGMSFAGVIKWILIICSGRFFYVAYQGLILKKTASGTERNIGEYLTGEAAVRAGWENLGIAVMFAIAAWAVWFFWQRNEE